jgi:hypothetical protein
MARQAEKEVNSLKKKLETAQQKAKDATDDLQDIVDGSFVQSLSIVFLWLGILSASTLDMSRCQEDGGSPEEGVDGDKGLGQGPQGEDQGGPRR